MMKGDEGMVKVYRLPVGTAIRYCGYLSDNWQLRLIVCDTEDLHCSDTIKGIMKSKQSKYTSSRFNDCHHTEMYGAISEPFEATIGGSLIKDCHLGWSFIYDPRYPKYEETVSLTSLGHRIITVNEGSTHLVRLIQFYEDRTHSRYGYWARVKNRVATKDIEVAKRQLEALYEQEVREGYWENYHNWQYPIGQGQVSWTARSTTIFAKEEIKQMLKIYDQLQIGESLRRERQLNLFQSAVNATQDIPTLSIAVQIGLDGLICQALSGLARLSATKWRELAKMGKADFLRGAMETWAQYDLSIKYGVLAPFRDYIDLAQKLDLYYRNLQTPNSGLVPFYWHASVSREHHKVGAWDVTLIAGVQWDFLRGSSIEDFFGILHTAGLDLSFTQLWDFTPLSFVADWGLNISKILEQFDARFNAMRYPVDYCWETNLCSQLVDYHGQTLQVKIYNRQTLPGIPSLEYYDLSWDNIHGTLSASNVKEAIAMFFSFFV
jgi:hypothetical protein